MLFRNVVKETQTHQSSRKDRRNYVTHRCVFNKHNSVAQIQILASDPQLRISKIFQSQQILLE